MYAIYGDIYHQYTPVMLAYIPYMDPMGMEKVPFIIYSRFMIINSPIKHGDFPVCYGKSKDCCLIEGQRY